MTAAVHFTIGGTSVMTAADTTVPAMNAVGVGQCIEPVIEAWDAIRQDFYDRRHAEDRKSVV